MDITKFNKINFKKALVATGTRPTRVQESIIPGISHAIDSDDVFFLKELPKKAIVIGGIPKLIIEKITYSWLYSDGNSMFSVGIG